MLHGMSADSGRPRLGHWISDRLRTSRAELPFRLQPLDPVPHFARGEAHIRPYLEPQHDLAPIAVRGAPDPLQPGDGTELALRGDRNFPFHLFGRRAGVGEETQDEGKIHVGKEFQRHPVPRNGADHDE